jgi:hypothetical protein
MSMIFLSYRRDDSADATDRICECLAERYGPDNVFMDIDSMPVGIDFRRHLSEMV